MGMAAVVIFTTMAAFGFFCFLCVLLGWLLPLETGCLCVLSGIPDEGVLCRWYWLRRAGLLHMPLIIVTRDSVDSRLCDGIEICSPEALLSRLEQERSQVHGTGDGDSSGRNQRRGISEL